MSWSLRSGLPPGRRTGSAAMTTATVAAAMIHRSPRCKCHPIVAREFGLAQVIEVVELRIDLACAVVEARQNASRGAAVAEIEDLLLRHGCPNGANAGIGGDDQCGALEVVRRPHRGETAA